MAKLSPLFNDQTLTAANTFASGYKLFTYAAGSSTKQSTFTDSAGTVPQSNPIILNASGQPTNGAIWLAAGSAYKFVLALPTDTDPPTSPVKTFDNIIGVGDTGSVSVSQWQPSGLTPTFVSTTSFTVPGDQTTELHVKRKLQFTTTAGTVYGEILTTAFGALTTVTMTMDAGQALDSGLSVVNVSMLRNDHLATPGGIAKSGALSGSGITGAAASGPLASSGITGAAASGANGDITSLAALASINGGAIAGMRNRIINGDMRIDTRNNGAGQNFVAGAALAYCADRFYGYCAGANITGMQTLLTSGQLVYQFIGATGNTGIGFGQRIEMANSVDLAGKTVTLSADLDCTVGNTVTWTAYYANSANAFGTLAAPTRTLIATGTFAIPGFPSPTARYSAQIAIPFAAQNGIEIVLSVGVLLNGWTWTIGNIQLETGSIATPFERRLYGFELAQCQRYGWPMRRAHGLVGNASTLVWRVGAPCPVKMRGTPILTLSGAMTVQAGAVASVNLTAITSSTSTADAAEFDGTIGATTAAAGSPAILTADNTNYIFVSAEL